MITGNDIYNVLAAIVPLYVSMILAYGSVRWWKVLNPEQCSGINRFVSSFAVPFLSFHFISSNNLYAMNYHFIAADSLQKMVILSALFLWKIFGKNGDLGWMITIFSISTLPNTLVMGIPLLDSMYGDFSKSLMIQIVVLQSVIWYTLLLFLYEYRGAKLLISDQLSKTTGTITSFKVDSDVVSLNGKEPLQADVEMSNDGKLCVLVKRSPSTKSNFDTSSIKYSSQSTPVPKQCNISGHSSRFSDLASSFPPLSPMISRSFSDGSRINRKESRSTPNNKDLLMFDWNTSSTKGMRPLSNNTTTQMNSCEQKDVDVEDGSNIVTSESPNNIEQNEMVAKTNKMKMNLMPPSIIVIKLILTMVWRKLIRNPNTYSCILGIMWSLISFKWNIEMPSMIKGSVAIISDAGLGMAMFSLGLSMALQAKLIPYAKLIATFWLCVRFILGPAVMAASAFAIGIRGDLLRVAIVQAALPQGIVPFVFAREYNVYPDLLSMEVIFGMLISLPITILYYVILEF